jgi:hypothetical protein
MKIKLMKNRSSLTIFTTMLSVLASLALLPQMQAAPDVVPGPDGCYPGFTTAEGCNALQNLTTGAGNTGVGWRSLFADMTGSFNTGLGAGALLLNTADSNTAVGAVALLLNTTGTENTAVGTDALVHNSTGSDNNAVGAFALFDNNGDFNNAHGRDALAANTTGIENEAFGDLALTASVTGDGNTAVGDDALDSANGASFNTAVGKEAGNSITTGPENTVVGRNAGTNIITGSGNIYLGVRAGAGVGDEFAFIRIGETTPPIVYDCFIQGIQDRAVSAALNPHFVIVDDNGKLGTVAVNEIGGKTAQHQAMLNEFLKEHLKVEELQATVAQQQKQIEALTAGLQKVSAQLEASKPAPQVANNP